MVPNNGKNIRNMIELINARKLKGKIVTFTPFGGAPYSCEIGDVDEIKRSMNSPYHITTIQFKTDQDEVTIPVLAIEHLLSKGEFQSAEGDLKYKLEE